MRLEHHALYLGRVMHRRLKPFRHRLDYRVFSLLVDIDRLDDLNALSPLLGYNRPALASFQDRDHGPRDGNPLRPWIDARLAEKGLDCRGGRIRLLCFPRLFGYVFNPLSIWYCEDAGGQLTAILYEVANTFGEQHSYLLPVTEEAGPVRQEAEKQFHVSPFLAMDCRYRFRLNRPGRKLNVLIREEDGDGDEILIACHDADYRALTRRNVIRAMLGHPLMTVKVIAGIHWEAAKLFAKGARYHARPRKAASPSSL